MWEWAIVCVKGKGTSVPSGPCSSNIRFTASMNSQNTNMICRLSRECVSLPRVL